MCGIIGLFRTEKDCEDTFNKEKKKLDHRGPDKLDYRVVSRGILGHSRLAIQDLSDTGNQPMVSHSGRFILVFNGEIYNALSLKETYLDPKNLSLSGTSDTEILLSCIELVGLLTTLTHTDGMFACALHDLHSGKVYLFRDRFGEKPLYYTFNQLNKSLSFASTLDSLLTLNEKTLAKENLSKEAVQTFLNFGYLFEKDSIVDDIKKVTPGTILEYCDAKNSLTETIRFDFFNPRVNKFNVIDRGTPEKVFRTIFEEAVASTLISDVPLGSFLSGGVDSTLVTAVANKMLPDNKTLKTFSIGFYDDAFDESSYSNKASELLGTDHTLKMFADEEILDFIPQISKSFCEPFSDSSCLPTMMVSKLASEKVKVCLTGDGADELFGGYTRYHHANRMRLKYRSSHSIYRHFLPLIKFSCHASKLLNSHQFKFISKLNKLKNLLCAKDCEEFYLQFLVLRNEVNLGHHLTGINKPINCTDDEFHDVMRETDIRIYLEGDILTKVDRSAMAFSLETRAPFLNQNILKFAKSFSIEHNRKHSVDKYFLRQLLLEYMPGDFFDRPKKGFSVPLYRWLTGPLNNWMNELIKEYHFYLDEIERVELRRMVKSLNRGNDLLAPKIWTYLMFLTWCKNNLEE